MMDVQIVDGGLSTELMRLGFPVDGNDPLWTSRYLLTDPDALRKAHLSFLQHGADIILTATYQASPELFEREAGVDAEGFSKLVQTACDVAMQAVQEVVQERKNSKVCSKRRPLVAGSVGAYGACLHDFSEYHGKYVDDMTVQQLREWHRPRVQALAAAGIDLLALETIPALKEAQALLSLLQDFPTIKAWMTFSCKDQTHLGHGELFSEAVGLVSSSPQVLAVGANCIPAENVTGLLKTAADSRQGKPLVVYPNAPGHQWTDQSLVGTTTGANFDTLMPSWVAAGARYIGGCCGTGAPDIQRLADLVRNDQTTS